MSTQPLSPETRRRVEVVFDPADWEAAERLLVSDCGTNLPFLDSLDSVGLERFRFAAMKLSKGKMSGLQEAVELAKEDWRDLLVSAEFANELTAHLRWQPQAGGG